MNSPPATATVLFPLGLPLGLPPSQFHSWLYTTKDGTRIAVTKLGEKLVYVVGFPDQPALHIGVSAANILDHVSPRTLEDYEYQQERLRNGKRKAKNVNQNSPERAEGSRAAPASSRGRGRPAKRKLDDAEGAGVKVMGSKKEAST
jgi:hypothetical protein